MAVRTVAIAAISALVLFAVWKKRVEIEALLTPTPPPPAIQFDNGSATPKTSSLPQQPQFAPGAMRKCINGTKVSYIDSPCPRVSGKSRCWTAGHGAGKGITARSQENRRLIGHQKFSLLAGIAISLGMVAALLLGIGHIPITLDAGAVNLAI